MDQDQAPTIRHLWNMSAQNNQIGHPGVAERHTFRPGHVFWLPPGTTWLNRDKPRPFALTTPSATGALGTLVYGSSQETEKRSGATAVEIAPVLKGLNRNGLSRRTFFYPGTLLPVIHERLPPPSGHLNRSLPELRAAMRIALGIGRGSCLGSNAPAGSCRGRIVVCGPALSRSIQAAHAVVLTGPAYSAERNYQIILPIFTVFAREIDMHDLLVATRKWAGSFWTVAHQVLLPIPLTQSVWHSEDIARETEYVVDGGTLAEIDRRLCEYFSLPAPAEDEL